MGRQLRPIQCIPIPPAVINDGRVVPLEVHKMTVDKVARVSAENRKIRLLKFQVWGEAEWADVMHLKALRPSAGDAEWLPADSFRSSLRPPRRPRLAAEQLRRPISQPA
jgi:hypothetical protein